MSYRKARVYHSPMFTRKIKVYSEFHAYAFWISLGVLGTLAVLVFFFVPVSA